MTTLVGKIRSYGVTLAPAPERPSNVCFVVPGERRAQRFYQEGTKGRSATAHSAPLGHDHSPARNAWAARRDLALSRPRRSALLHDGLRDDDRRRSHTARARSRATLAGADARALGGTIPARCA